MLKNVNAYYFIGIGGIGMSALAKYFHLKGNLVAGYDKTPSSITNSLQAEGIEIVFEENSESIPAKISCLTKESLAIIYTPAVPKNHPQLNLFKNTGFEIFKRSIILGHITQNSIGIAVAGTHGKTTVSTLIAHLLKQTLEECSAFLGGISKNYNTNFLFSEKCNKVVIEADEFDRSFLTLDPSLSVITAMDADHLDIYGDVKNIQESFNLFANRLPENGIMIHKEGLPVELRDNIRKYTYSIGNEDSDFFAKDVEIIDGFFHFTLVSQKKEIKNLILGLPGRFNLENAIAAAAAALFMGVTEIELRTGLASFTGVARRFDFQIRTDEIVFIDDYAHHPEELKACILSLKELYPKKKLTGVFQPHLYSRTKDFAEEFAQALNLLDEAILLPIYPAREKPIKGIHSELILGKMTIEKKQICNMSNLVDTLSEKKLEVLITMGAGDIEIMVAPIKTMLTEKKYE